MCELIWYHGNITKIEALKRFRQFHPDGSYLVRDSQTVEKAYVLSVGFQKNVYHYRIMPGSDHGYFLGAKEFYSLSDLINFYQVHQEDLVCLLKHPVIPPLPSDYKTTDTEHDDAEDLHDYEKPISVLNFHSVWYDALRADYFPMIHRGLRNSCNIEYGGGEQFSTNIGWHSTTSEGSFRQF